MNKKITLFCVIAALALVFFKRSLLVFTADGRSQEMDRQGIPTIHTDKSRADEGNGVVYQGVQAL